MTLYTFHLAELRPSVTARALWRSPTSMTVPGLRRAECLALMRLGAPTVSPDRLQLRRMAVFAAWDGEAAVESFLDGHELGRALAAGWHVRLQFLRRWGEVAAFPTASTPSARWDPEEPVVAVTVARMRLPEVPRFLRWGKPVERLVRDHPATTLALASMRPPRTISTFSVWRSVREMTEMVHGRSNVAAPERHASAMAERRRRDFHHEFATFRFRPLSEHGVWNGRTGIVPR